MQLQIPLMENKLKTLFFLIPSYKNNSNQVKENQEFELWLIKPYI